MILIISLILILIILINQYLSRKKRFQNCNKLEQIWRYRYYLKVPLIWLIYIFRYTEVSKIGLWKLLIGEAQLNMNWMYTSDEVYERTINKKKKTGKTYGNRK